MLVTCRVESWLSYRNFHLKIQGLGMKLWHAIGVQLLSVLLREHHRAPAADPNIDCSSEVTGGASEYPQFSLVLAGFAIGKSTEALLTFLLFCARFLGFHQVAALVAEDLGDVEKAFFLSLKPGMRVFLWYSEDVV